MSTSISNNRCIVDASIAIKWYLDDEEYVEEARAILVAYATNEITLLAPEHIRFEVPNALLVAANRHRLDRVTARLAVSNFLATRILTAGDYAMLISAFDYAIRFTCAFYDALYLAMADRFACPFIHADRRLHSTLAGRFAREMWIEDYPLSLFGQLVVRGGFVAEESDRMQEFIDTQGRELFEVLTNRGQEVGPGAEDPAGCCYDLMEIAIETQKLFNEMIPTVLAARDADIDTLQDAWWDVYFAFHHINYHIHATLWPED